MPSPSENKALEALRHVQSLDSKALNDAITAEVGTPMLGIFDTLARASLPEASKEQLHRAVHLMVLSYLMRVEATK